MATTLTCYDEAMNGDKQDAFTIELASAQTTLREIIRSRIYQEVSDYNQHKGDIFKGLVKPSDTEQVLNGYKLKKPRLINWEEQADNAIQAFLRNGFFVMIDNKQRTELDEIITITPETMVSFVKLVPLVGG